MKKTVIVLLAAIVIAAGAAGCATERESHYTATGAGIGAVTGAILGAALGSFGGNAGEGAVIGSIFGGLAGASIGNNEYHMQRSEEDAARMYSYNYDTERRDLIRIEDTSVNPPVAHPGEEVTLSATYTVLSPYRHAQTVHEVREVSHNGRIIGRPQFTARRQDGTWASSVPLRIPPDAEPGTYVITTIIETDNAGDTRESNLKVEGGSGWRR